MGFFSRIGNKISSFVNWVSDKLGGRSYSGGSVHETIDVEKVLSEFKADLKEKAEELEKENLTKVTESFDEFTDRIKNDYPDLIPAIRGKRRALYGSVNGCIVTYTEKHISENDPEFQRILKMSPGEEKKQKLQEKMEAILQQAEAAFNQKLGTGMAELQDELGGRLSSELSAKEKQLEKELQDITDLTEQVDSGTVNLEKYDNEHLVLAETADCLEAILEQGEQVK